jgi:hypothetical protein
MAERENTMKPSRFIIGYSNYKIDEISKDGGTSAEERNEKLRRIDRAVRMYETGALTVDETIRAINAE